jgi:hypothetical protein
MATQLFVTGTLHGLARRIGKIGGEVITFVVTTKNLDAWNNLVAMTEQNVEVTLQPPQGQLDLDKKPDGEKPARSRKEPRDGRAADQPEA